MNKGEQVQIREVRESDLDALVDLMARVYGRRHRTANASFLRWQYWENPEGPVVGHVAFSGTTAVASYTLIPLPCAADGVPSTIYLSLNTAVAPSHRRSGMFVRLAALTIAVARQSRAIGVIGFPNNQSVHGLVRHLGWQYLGRMQALGVVLRPGALVLNRIAHREWRRGPADGWSDTAARNRDPHNLDELTQALSTLAQGANAPLASAFPERHVRWRYLSCPLWNYEFAWSSGREAVTVCRHGTLWNMRCTVLADFGATTRDERKSSASIREAVIAARAKESVHVATLTSPTHQFKSSLRAAGFFPIPGFLLPHPAHVCFLRFGGPNIDRAQDIHMAVGFYDAV